MNVFMIIWRSFWGLALAILLSVGCVYIAISNTLLSEPALTKIVNEANIVQTVRSDIILPRIVSIATESEYSNLLDKPLITKAFNAAVPADSLRPKLAPAIKSLRAWLDSKEPDISFTVKADDLSKNFIDTLTKEANAKIAKLPACTYQNSLQDAENGTCQSPYISKEDLSATIDEAIKSEPSFQLAEISSEDIQLPKETVSATKKAPEFINILYAASLLSAGIAILIALWLITKHRLSGFITIGGAGLAVAIVLLVASYIMPQLIDTFKDKDIVYNIAKATSNNLRPELRLLAGYFAICGGTIVIIATGVKVLLSRRNKEPSVHL